MKQETNEIFKEVLRFFNRDEVTTPEHLYKKVFNAAMEGNGHEFKVQPGEDMNDFKPHKSPGSIPDPKQDTRSQTKFTAPGTPFIDKVSDHVKKQDAIEVEKLSNLAIACDVIMKTANEIDLSVDQQESLTRILIGLYLEAMK